MKDDDDRDNDDSREGIARTTRAWLDLNRRAGNEITHADARRRVAGARTRGDEIREQGN